MSSYADNDLVRDPNYENDKEQDKDHKEFMALYKDILSSEEIETVQDVRPLSDKQTKKVQDFDPADSTSDDDKDSQSSVKKLRKRVRDH